MSRFAEPVRPPMTEEEIESARQRLIAESKKAQELARERLERQEDKRCNPYAGIEKKSPKRQPLL